jgi:hypothetical protein
VCRNATINEDANCTHYLDGDDDEGGEQQERGAESTEDEGEESTGFEDPDHEFCREDQEFSSYPPQTTVEGVKCNVDNGDVYGDQQQSGVGSRPPASSTSWCAEDD